MRATQGLPGPACLHDLHDFLGSEAERVPNILDLFRENHTHHAFMHEEASAQRPEVEAHARYCVKNQRRPRNEAVPPSDDRCRRTTAIHPRAAVLGLSAHDQILLLALLERVSRTEEVRDQGWSNLGAECRAPQIDRLDATYVRHDK